MVTLRFVYKEKVIHLSGKLSRQENTLHAQTNASLVLAIMCVQLRRLILRNRLKAY